jgi:tryptophan synthase beta subunit
MLAGVGPEHAFLKYTGRAEYVNVTDGQALDGMKELSRVEGIIPALETSHAVFHALNMAKGMGQEEHLVILLSGRGDKDMSTVSAVLGMTTKFD